MNREGKEERQRLCMPRKRQIGRTDNAYKRLQSFAAALKTGMTRVCQIFSSAIPSKRVCVTNLSNIEVNGGTMVLWLEQDVP